MSKQHARQRLWLYLLYAAGVVVATLQRGVISREHTTFAIFRQSFVHLVQHRDLYAAYPAEQGAAAADLFKYSPSAAVFLAPLALLPFAFSLLVWNATNAALLVVAVKRVLPEAKVNLALLLLAPEVFVAIQSSSSNALVAALILLAVVAYLDNRPARAAIGIVIGTAIKIFPIAALVFAITQRRRARALATCILAFVIVFALPLLVVGPHELMQQYQSWFRLEGSDALDHSFGLSIMRAMRDWLDYSGPNWIIQAVGTIFFLLPLALHRDRWTDRNFAIQYACSLLVYVVLFNHQAERQSCIIAATGMVIWFVTSPRSVERWVLLALALAGLPTFPYLVVWLVIHAELLQGTPTVALDGGRALVLERRAWRIARPRAAWERPERAVAP